MSESLRLCKRSIESSKMQNKTDWLIFSLSNVHWSFKLEIVNICRHTASLKSWASNVQTFWNFKLSPMHCVKFVPLIDFAQRLLKIFTDMTYCYALNHRVYWSLKCLILKELTTPVSMFVSFLVSVPALYDYGFTPILVRKLYFDIIATCMVAPAVV